MPAVLTTNIPRIVPAVTLIRCGMMLDTVMLPSSFMLVSSQILDPEKEELP